MRLVISIAAAVVVASVPASAEPTWAPQVDAVMAKWSRKDAPGCAVGVIQAKQMLYAKGFGMADLERNVPITPDTVFDIASMSKQFTAASVFLLGAAGKLSLDDDIRTYLPELPSLGKVTLRQMLHHTSGLRDYVELLEYAGVNVGDVVGNENALDMLARQQALEFAPGTDFAYSNTNYLLLAQVVERTSKRTLPQFLHDRVFQPLGMTRTSVNDDHSRLVPGRALGYEEAKGGWRLSMSNWEDTGDGGVLTTLGDLARWDANFYDATVGGKALIAAMLEPGKLANGKVLDYAGGLWIEQHRGEAFVQHDGAWAGYRSELVRFPALQTSVLVLCNAASADASALALDIADLVLAKQLAAPTKQPKLAPGAPAAKPAAIYRSTAAELASYAGRYHSVELAVDWTLRVEGGSLVARAGIADATGAPSAKDELVLPAWDTTIRFTRGTGGITGFAADSGRLHGMRFNRLP